MFLVNNKFKTYKGLDFAGMARCSSCFTSKESYSHAFWISCLPESIVYIDSSEARMDGKRWVFNIARL